MIKIFTYLNIQIFKYPPQGGFTLIELIVASGIYAGVALMGFAILANTDQIRTKTDTQGTMIESVSLSLETLAREARLGTFTIEAADGTAATPESGTNQLVGNRLAIVARDPVTGAASYRYALVTEEARPGNPHHKSLSLTTCLDATCRSVVSTGPLTPDQVEVNSISFRGLDSTISDRAPYAQIILTLQAPGLNQPPVVIQTMISGRRSS